MSITDEELNIFKAFIETCPNFAGCKVDWKPSDDPPDILCRYDNGQRIGVELGEWLHQKQTERSRAFENLEDEITAHTIRDKDFVLNNNVLMFPPSDNSIFPRKTARQKFIEELFDYLQQNGLLTRRVDTEISLKIPDDFNTLKKYIDHMIIYPPETSVGRIAFSRGGSYSPDDAIEALHTLLTKKIKKYSKLREDQNLDDLYLVVHYDRALSWNTPYKGVNGGIEKIVRFATEHLKNGNSVFGKVFLFLALNPGRTVYKLFPG